MSDFATRAFAERERTMARPHKGDTVAVFIDGSTEPAMLRSGKIVCIHDDGWTVDVDLNPRKGQPNALLVRCTFAPHRALRDGERRPAKSWDFIV